MSGTPAEQTAEQAVEQVVLLDEQGRAIGAADKATVHHRDTPLHLAFSCYLFDDGGRLLLTRRALHKVTWPGVWTNSCCGHPGPGEPLTDAVHRRVREELGVGIDDLRLLLPTFRYRAEMGDGVVENEMCPVYVGRVRGPLAPNPDEVGDVSWVSWSDLRADVRDGARPLSPWALEQVGGLPDEPFGVPARAETEMPVAARG